ncbi:hypothetical protein AAEX63_14290 [Luteococcus sp. H138]|uniref:LysM peptidoglycan-binding domain-containing protein n=1 Tax=unclassified Luteococcus TaxID=2639923 RepID=UPI00313D476C
MTTLRRRLHGLAALFALGALMVGLPAALVATVGNPLPGSIPSPGQWWQALTAPDDGTLALSAIGLLGWLVWAYLAVLILLETVARLRGRTAPMLPGWHAPQLGIRRLVATATLVLVTAPLLGTPTASAEPRPTPPAATATAQTAPSSPATAKPTGTGVRVHVVTEGESLSSIAADELHDADRWPELAQASRRTVQPDGAHLTDPNVINPGWRITIPTSTTQPQTDRQARTIVVHEGDTLAQLARTHLGDPERWPEIYEASRSASQPDGARLTDPDIILPGWTLTIPGQTAPATEKKPQVVSRTPKPTDRPRTTASQTSTPAPAPSPSSAASTARAHSTATPAAAPVNDEVEAHDGVSASWLLTGLASGGGLLAASALMVLRRRRVVQASHRRPGRQITLPPPELAPVEQTLVAAGTPVTVDLANLDAHLRHLAADALAAGHRVPHVAAVRVTTDHVEVHLAEATDSMPSAWTATGDSGRCWATPLHPNLGAIEAPAPYPLLVTAGTDHDQAVWLVNLEQLGVLHLTGDADYAHDFARYAAAEIAVNPWSRGVRATCLDAGVEAIDMNPNRLHQPTTAVGTIETITDDARRTVHLLSAEDAAVEDKRCRATDGEAWLPKALITTDAHTIEVNDLTSMIIDHPSRTGTAVLMVGESNPDSDAARLVFTAHGQARLEPAGLALIPAGLTPDEALGCAALLAQADILTDESVPPAGDTGWREITDAAGAIATHSPSTTVEDQAQPTWDVEGDHDASVSLPPTVEDDAEWARLLPEPDDTVAQRLRELDPTLDADLADWNDPDTRRPKLSLLGPVKVIARGKTIAKRKPYYTEMLSYIALREHGATPDEVADAMNVSAQTVRTGITTIREWLGTNPTTGERYLPDATNTPAALDRGVPVYQVPELLVDIDLMRRLRARAQAAGEDGIDDLEAALGLAQGRPFDQLRPGGWGWLAHTGLEHHITVSIVDIAHTVSSHHLTNNDTARARASAEAALRAAPEDTITRLDLAAVATGEGRLDEAHILQEEVRTMLDDEELPADLSPRSLRLLIKPTLTTGA